MPRPARASSCYLVRDGDTAVVLDIGSGAFAKLRTAIEYTAVDAIVVTHMHADHFIDVIPYRYGLTYGPLEPRRRPRLVLPPGGEATLRELCRAFDPEGRGDFLDGAYDVGEYDPAGVLEIGCMQLTFAPARHFIDSYAIRVRAGKSALAYSGDTAPCDEVVGCARDSDVFLCESTLGVGTETGDRGHCSAGEAGEMARRAGAARLALTHYGSQESPQAMAGAARAAFGGDVVVVDDDMEFEV